MILSCQASSKFFKNYEPVQNGSERGQKKSHLDKFCVGSRGHMQSSISFCREIKNAKEKVLLSKKLAPPSLVLLLTEEGEVSKQFLIGDETRIIMVTNNVLDGLFLLLCWYYITDPEYPRCYSQLHGLCQQTVFKQPFQFQKSSSFVHFFSKKGKLLSNEVAKEQQQRV